MSFTDNSVPKVVKLDIHQMGINVTNLVLPALDQATQLHLAGAIRGIHHDGNIALDGTASLASRQSEVKLSLKSVELLPLAPYLLKASDTGIKQGTLDMDIHSSLKNNHLHAPGHIALHNLALNTHGGFMGVSESAAVALLKNHQGEISAHFTLDGDLNDPHFSFNENLLQRTGAGLAEAMGVSVEGLTRHVSSAAESIGSKLKNVFH